MRLTDEQWAEIEPIIPSKEKLVNRRGRPFQSARDVLDGVLWILKTGARWRDLPKGYPPGTTCHRRFKGWREGGVMKKILERLAAHLKKLGVIDLTETYIDASFVRAKKGDLKLVKQRQVKALKSWQLSTIQVFHSPYALNQLHYMRVNLLKERLGSAILKTHLNELWVTKLKTGIFWMLDLQKDIELSLLLPTGQLEKTVLKMGELLEDTKEDGKSKDFFLGYNPISG